MTSEALIWHLNPYWNDPLKLKTNGMPKKDNFFIKILSNQKRIMDQNIRVIYKIIVYFFKKKNWDLSDRIYYHPNNHITDFKNKDKLCSHCTIFENVKKLFVKCLENIFVFVGLVNLPNVKILHIFWCSDGRTPQNATTNERTTTWTTSVWQPSAPPGDSSTLIELYRLLSWEFGTDRITWN